MESKTNLKREKEIIDNPIDQILVEFNENTPTVILLRLILENIQTAAEFYYYEDLKSAIRRYEKEPNEQIYKKVLNFAKYNQTIQKILNTLVLIDQNKIELGFFAGIKSDYEFLIEKEKVGNSETDPLQVLDTGIKAIAFGYIVSLISEELSLNFLRIKAGIELLYYFILVKLVLPFANYQKETGAGFLYQILQEREKEISKIFSDFIDKHSYQKARYVLDIISYELDQASSEISKNFLQIKENLTNVLPNLMNVTDSTPEGISITLNLMPMWKFLGARLSAEACVLRVLSTESM